MKRFSLLLALILMLNLAGCCHAPGTEGMYGMDSWYQNIPTFPAGDSSSEGEQATQPLDDDYSEEIATIPDPTIDLDALPARENDDFVKVTDYIPDIVVELKYATVDNFTGTKVYDFSDVYLRYGTVMKLMQVQKELRQQGLLLKIWDGFRPKSAQQTLWDAYPDAKYVSNPANGYSNHSRGNTVDVTVVNASGEELEMPSAFDAFSELADRDYSDCTEEAAANAQMLEDLMTQYGFVGYEGEWWHFADEKQYDVEEIFDPGVVSLWYAVCNQYINMRIAPDFNSEAIGQIPKDHSFTLLGWADGFAYVEYKGQRGYVNADYISPL